MISTVSSLSGQHVRRILILGLFNIGWGYYSLECVRYFHGSPLKLSEIFSRGYKKESSATKSRKTSNCTLIE